MGYCGPPVSVQLTAREMHIVREALAAEAGIPEWSAIDTETIEGVIAKLQALGARGGL